MMSSKMQDKQFENMAISDLREEVKNEEWPDPIPIDRDDSLPEFPVSMIPSPGREMIDAVAAVNQVSPGMPGAMYLAVVSMCLAKKAVVNLHTHKEPINLYLCSVANPGERKSSTIKIITEPIYDYQKQCEADMKDQISEAYNTFKINEKRLEALQKKAAKCDSEMLRRKLKSEAAELAKIINDNPVPKAPIFIVDDITSEAIASIMSNNDGRASVISAEGGIFDNMNGRYNERGGPNFEIYLKAHAGDPWSSHRIGRKPETMMDPALTMGLTVQPSVIQAIGSNKQFRGRGLLARFLYSINPAQAGQRERQFKTIDEGLLRSYKVFIHSLMDIPFLNAEFIMTPEGSERWDANYNIVESEMLPGRSLEYLPDFGSKLPGAVARIAGLLHFAEFGSHAVNKPISVNIVNAACEIGHYFKEHALAAFGLMKEDPKIEVAKKINSYIRRQKPDTFKGRDVLRHTNIKSIDEANDGLHVLIERAYIRELITRYEGMGRPEAKTYEVNKKIHTLGESTDNNDISRANG